MTHRILVVDDDRAVRESFERQLAMLGYEPTTVENAERAMRSLHDIAPAIVITDVRMPEVSGL
jgi:DNA-binding NtrC family response regulator